MNHNIVYVIHVDDNIITGLNLREIEALITSLGIAKEDHCHRDEGEVGDFLGIRIEKTGNTQFRLTQIGIINKALKTTGMEICKPCLTSCGIKTLGKDQDDDVLYRS